MWKNIKNIDRQESSHYSILCRKKGVNGLAALREIFKDAKTNELNFVLFSTSGIHGSYNTIEEAEKGINGEIDEYGDKYSQYITFLVVHPRLVTLRYGECIAITLDDIAFLKKLRKNSLKSVSKIGM